MGGEQEVGIKRSAVAPLVSGQQLRITIVVRGSPERLAVLIAPSDQVVKRAGHIRSERASYAYLYLWQNGKVISKLSKPDPTAR